MDLKERFLRYVAVDTASDEASDTCPSTERQKNLARLLVKEMRDAGIADAYMDGDGYVYGHIPENTPGQPAIGLIAHMDTVDNVPSGGIRPRSVRYEGGDIVLNGEKNILLRETDFEALSSLRGQELIVTDGTTLLGADDKAGIAVIMDTAEKLLRDPSIPHGRVCIGFTPDEEIGRGADRFDLNAFGADFAYTLDGDRPDCIEYENFNAASAAVAIRGRSIHPGSAKNKMLHAVKLGMRFQEMLPPFECPEHTEGREGFIHMTAFSGTEEKAEIRYILRDHDAGKLEKKKERLLAAAAFLNAEYGDGTVRVEIRDSYRNMLEIIRQHPEVICRAEDAIRKVGLTPQSKPVRGGTDGARLSFMGLPCPNLGTGGGNYHGVYEYVSVDGMKKAVDICLELILAR